MVWQKGHFVYNSSWPRPVEFLLSAQVFPHNTSIDKLSGKESYLEQSRLQGLASSFFSLSRSSDLKARLCSQTRRIKCSVRMWLRSISLTSMRHLLVLWAPYRVDRHQQCLLRKQGRSTFQVLSHLHISDILRLAFHRLFSLEPGNHVYDVQIRGRGESTTPLS